MLALRYGTTVGPFNAPVRKISTVAKLMRCPRQTVDKMLLRHLRDDSFIDW